MHWVYHSVCTINTRIHTWPVVHQVHWSKETALKSDFRLNVNTKREKWSWQSHSTFKCFPLKYYNRCYLGNKYCCAANTICINQYVLAKISLDSIRSILFLYLQKMNIAHLLQISYCMHFHEPEICSYRKSFGSNYVLHGVW